MSGTTAYLGWCESQVDTNHTGAFHLVGCLPFYSSFVGYSLAGYFQPLMWVTSPLCWPRSPFFSGGSGGGGKPSYRQPRNERATPSARHTHPLDWYPESGPNRDIKGYQLPGPSNRRQCTAGLRNGLRKVLGKAGLQGSRDPLARGPAGSPFLCRGYSEDSNFGRLKS